MQEGDKESLRDSNSTKSKSSMLHVPCDFPPLGFTVGFKGCMAADLPVAFATLATYLPRKRRDPRLYHSVIKNTSSKKCSGGNARNIYNRYIYIYYIISCLVTQVFWAKSHYRAYRGYQSSGATRNLLQTTILRTLSPTPM